ncbi:hypothetical protein ACHHYP_07971 [Achlya hypogyna]|uniref:Jacalin-type lectin domain-containing protein n=1 Tax=Achlya hypogyna TaxID=1202772 RepID=A0A1V9YQ79_ACHHY|nr:hypothetical protein ACHHYP_07971 [Achlya hypogyna]
MSTEEASIEITSSDIAQFPLALLEGRFHCNWELPDNVLAEIYVDDQATSWPVTHDGRFVALLPLPSLGQHEVCINIAETYHITSVNYSPVANTHGVRVYLVGDASATGKARLFASLLQTTYGKLGAAFALEQDAQGQPVVRVLQGTDIDAALNKQADYAPTVSTTKHLVLVDGASSGVCADRHASVVVLTLPGISSWPDRVGELVKSFLDSTAYGAALSDAMHQLGHAFGLGHTRDGLMALPATSHAIPRLLSVYESVPGGRVPPYTKAFPDGKLFVDYSGVRAVDGPADAHWHAVSALRLQKSAFVAPQAAAAACAAPKVLWPGDVRGPVGIGGATPFGLDARGRCDVAGFLLHSDSSHVHAIEMLSQGALNDLLFAGLSAGGTQDMFLLMDGEYINRLDVAVSNKGLTIAAVRFHTNLRTSRYFGGRGGGFETLRPPQGHHFYALFGAASADGVGSLGAFYAPVPVSVPRPTTAALAAVATTAPAAASMADTLLQQFGSLFSTPPPALASVASGSFATVGLGASDGDQDPFATPKGIGAVVITCTDAIVALATLSVAEYRAKSHDGYYCADDEHVLSLVPNEVIVQVDVRASEWVHALRFHTNRRVSPWFGGADGVESHFVCPADACVTGFYGSHGRRYLGTLGAYFGPPPPPEPMAPVMLPAPPTTPAPIVDRVLHGVVVDVADGRLAARSVHEATDADALAPSQALFRLAPGEALVQVDVARDADHAVVGLCLHTQRRCSRWFGRITDVYERLPAPEAEAVHSLVLAGNDICLTFAPRAACLAHDAGDTGPSADHVEVQCAGGHFMAVLLKMAAGDLIAEAVLSDGTPGQPTSMYYPMEILEAKAGGSLKDYCLEVVDDAGQATRVRCPL